MFVVKFFLLFIVLTSFSFIEAGNISRYSTLSEVINHIQTDFYVSDIDEKELEYSSIRAYLQSLKDPYTRFLTPPEYKKYQQRLFGGYFYGIGVYIEKTNNGILVVSTIPSGPAFKSGIKSKDYIISIDGHKTKDLSLAECNQLIEGKEGTPVLLKIRRQNKLLEILLFREKVDFSSVGNVQFFNNEIGYIHLKNFEDQNLSFQVSSEVDYLINKGMRSLIIDLRFNGGGRVDVAVDLLSLFINDGIAVVLKDRFSQDYPIKMIGNVIYPVMPLIVLVNKSTVSAAEIFVGAIKDHRRGFLLGESTFGKASIQKVTSLEDGSALIYTVSKYFTPGYLDISDQGVTVDVKIPVKRYNQSGNFEFGNIKYDIQLQQAVKFALKDKKSRRKI